MKITLEIVRQVLRAALGFNSFTASFITSVSENTDHPTAGITMDGRLVYNPIFVNQHITCTEDVFSLIFHELLHPMFGHFIHRPGRLENIAADAIINAVISTVYWKHSFQGSLFKKTHNPKGLAGLMRPDSNLYRTKYERVYYRLYRQGRSSDSLSTGELIQTLRILTQTENLDAILLLGTHGEQVAGRNSDGLPKDVLARIAEDIRRSAHQCVKGAVYSLNLLDMLMEALRTHLSIKRVLLQRFATKRKVDRFKELCQARRISTSPVPIHPSKRDLVLLAAGAYPFRFRNQIQQFHQRDRGLAVYLDVSGSVNNHLPKILGILRHLRNEITTIFQFSNEVVETAFEDLLHGKIKTTHGTDFNCIANSIIERGFDKAVIITDGYASMDENLKKALQKRRVETLTIIFAGGHHDMDLAEFGEVVELKEVCN